MSKMIFFKSFTMIEWVFVTLLGIVFLPQWSLTKLSVLSIYIVVLDLPQHLGWLFSPYTEKAIPHPVQCLPLKISRGVSGPSWEPIFHKGPPLDKENECQCKGDTYEKWFYVPVTGVIGLKLIHFRRKKILIVITRTLNVFIKFPYLRIPKNDWLLTRMSFNHK